jgi:hypothetical protein
MRSFVTNGPGYDLRKVEAGAADPHIAIKVLTVPFASSSDAMAVLSRGPTAFRA